MERRSSQHDVDMVMAMMVPALSWNNLRLMMERTVYRIEPEFHGEIPVLKLTARKCSPLFWMTQGIMLFMSLTVFPLMMAWATLRNTYREIKGVRRRATEIWELEFVRNEARPSLNYEI